MRKLKWIDDGITAFWAGRVDFVSEDTPLPQYDGAQSLGLLETWQKHLPTDTIFPNHSLIEDEKSRNVLLPSPTNIIRCFKEDNLSAGLVLVILWGAMTRTKGRIYTATTLEMGTLLSECKRSISDSRSVEAAWNLLVANLNWSDVITSKVLHFLTRSLNFADPPVPIDHAVIKSKLWIRFISEVQKIREKELVGSKPLSWDDEDNSWLAYNRYMTFIRCQAKKKGWTTTQVENTIFRELL